MIEVIDDFISVPYQHALLDKVAKNYEFPWNFMDDMSAVPKRDNLLGKSAAEFQHGLENIMYYEGNPNQNSEYIHLVTPLTYTIMQHYNSSIHLFRVKAGMVTNNHGVAYPHVDFSFDHKSLVYYINDSDGDTVFYNEWFTGHDSVPDRFTVQESVSPKMGRAVIFDGLQYHSTEYPSAHGYRAFLNINFMVK